MQKRRLNPQRVVRALWRRFKLAPGFYNQPRKHLMPQLPRPFEALRPVGGAPTAVRHRPQALRVPRMPMGFPFGRRTRDVILAKYYSEKYGIPLDWFRKRHTVEEVYDMARKIAEQERKERLEYLKEYAQKLGVAFVEKGGYPTPKTIENDCKRIGEGYVVYEDRVVHCVEGRPVSHGMLPSAGQYYMSLSRIRLPPEPIYKSPMLRWGKMWSGTVNGEYKKCLYISSEYAFNEWAKEYGLDQLKKEAKMAGYNCIKAGQKIIDVD